MVVYPCLDELGRVSLADEHFQQAELGLDMLILVILDSQWGAVFLLHVSMETRSGLVRTN